MVHILITLIATGLLAILFFVVLEKMVKPNAKKIRTYELLLKIEMYASEYQAASKENQDPQSIKKHADNLAETAKILADELKTDFTT